MKEAIDKTNIFDPTGLRDSREMLAKQQDLGIKISAFPDVQWASVDIRPGRTSRAVESAAAIRQRAGHSRRQHHLVSQSHQGHREPGSRFVRRADQRRHRRDRYQFNRPARHWLTRTIRCSANNARPRRESNKRYAACLVGFPAKVAVSAEIDPTMDVQKTTLTYDQEPTNLSNKTTKIEVTNHRQPVRGIPGTATNAIGNRAASLERKKKFETSRTKEDARETTGRCRTTI